MNQYKSTTKSVVQIGNELGVGSVLEGSVRKAGDRLRIRVQLIDIGSDEHRWAQTVRPQTRRHLRDSSRSGGANSGRTEVELLDSERLAIDERPTTSLAVVPTYLRGIQTEQRMLGDPAGDRQVVEDPKGPYGKTPGVGGVCNPRQPPSRPDALEASCARGRSSRSRTRGQSSGTGPELARRATASGNLAMQLDLDWSRAEAEFR